jgi:hypothetical protein
MNVIYFNKNGKPVSDFEIEQKYQELKNFNEITISNQLLLSRFRLGVAQKEIEPFKVILTDIDDKIRESEINSYFELYEVLNSNICCLTGKYAHRIISNKEKETLFKYSKQTIIFSNDASPISDYDIESFYQNNKNKELIIINNDILLYRFCVGVAEKDIEPFYVIFKNENYVKSELVSCNGNLTYMHHEYILNQEAFFISSIWKIIANRNKEKN